MAFGMAGRPKRRARLMAEGKWPPPGHGSGVSKKSARSAAAAEAAARGYTGSLPSPIDKIDFDFWDRNGMWDFDFYGSENDPDIGWSTRGQAHLEVRGYTLILDEYDGAGIRAEIYKNRGIASLNREDEVKGVLSQPTFQYESMDGRSKRKREKQGEAFLGKVQGEFLTWVLGRQIGSFLAGMF